MPILPWKYCVGTFCRAVERKSRRRGARHNNCTPSCSVNPAVGMATPCEANLSSARVAQHRRRQANLHSSYFNACRAGKRRRETAVHAAALVFDDNVSVKPQYGDLSLAPKIISLAASRKKPAFIEKPAPRFERHRGEMSVIKINVRRRSLGSNSLSNARAGAKCSGEKYYIEARLPWPACMRGRPAGGDT